MSRRGWVCERPLPRGLQLCEHTRLFQLQMSPRLWPGGWTHLHQRWDLFDKQQAVFEAQEVKVSLLLPLTVISVIWHFVLLHSKNIPGNLQCEPTAIWPSYLQKPHYAWDPERDHSAGKEESTSLYHLIPPTVSLLDMCVINLSTPTSCLYLSWMPHCQSSKVTATPCWVKSKFFPQLKPFAACTLCLIFILSCLYYHVAWMMHNGCFDLFSDLWCFSAEKRTEPISQLSTCFPFPPMWRALKSTTASKCLSATVAHLWLTAGWSCTITLPIAVSVITSHYNYLFVSLIISWPELKM